MPKKEHIQKVMVIGSGPIIIGQAAEFDYSGTQACKSLKEEGIEVVLINSNPATIMTDMDVADKVYIEPITLDFVKKVLYTEKPDGILPSLGGQTGLNMAIELSKDGILDELGIELLGTSLNSIKKAEDRDLFKKTMEEIGEKVAHSTIVTNLDDALVFAQEVGFPIIIRPAYTLGGTGGGIAHDMEEFKYIVGRGLKMSMIKQVLLEQSVAGWKEIEYEVMRDNADNCIVICNMENFDPVGVHTGDSIVVAPSQTLSDVEYQMLRTASIKIIRALEINGGCNIQFALNPKTFEYVVIEVNPRVSRSSALASKATGYPIARVTAKIAIGMNLDEIKNSVTQNTYACFEPSLDYVVTKIPRWPFDKFGTGNRTLGTQMKATGEVMAIGRTFEESLLKAIDSLDIKLNYQLGLKEFNTMSIEALREYLKTPHDESIFAICKALQKGVPAEEVVELTKVDYWFIKKLEKIVLMADELMSSDITNIDYDLMDRAKKVGFGDSYIANLLGTTVDKVIEKRKQFGIYPVYKIVDTCAGEFEAVTPYYYSTYESKDDVIQTDNRKVLVIGSGPIRIGQGIEFDYCSVHSVQTLRELGIESIIVNNNPETVSTDFDTSDKLYFEPLTKECVLDIIEKEKPEGVIVQFGGQTAINLAGPLHKAGVNILGTSVHDIDVAEDRDKFLKLLEKLDIPIPPGSTAFSIVQAVEIANRIGYPVLVRPSYVLGGRAMEIVYNDKELKEYMQLAVDISTQHPVLIDKYITGKEVEVDGIADGTDVLIPGIMEHIERAGVHSGDSMAIYPPQTLSEATQKTIVEYTEKLARALHVKGLFNIQFVLDENNKVYVIEVNPRASRTIPILSKVTGIPMITLATKIIMGSSLKELGYGTGLAQPSEYIAVKAPVFSFSKLATVDTFLGPEMKSTGEVMGVDKDFHKALYKALIASGLKVPDGGNVLLSIAERNREESIILAKKLLAMGYKLLATDNTYEYMKEKGINITLVPMADVQKWLKEDKIDMVINTPTKGKISTRNGFILRRTAMEYNVPCITSLDTVNAILTAFESMLKDNHIELCALNEYSFYKGAKIIHTAKRERTQVMKHLLSLHDVTVEEVQNILKLAEKLKLEQKRGIPHPLLKGKTLGMIFSKSSTRTRVSFEVGMVQLGGHPLFLSANDIQLGRGESIYDTTKVLSRYINGIMIRTFKQSDVEELAQHASIPVINGLTDLLHPCQILADLLTIYEYKKKLEGLKLAYVGDGNNVAHSLLYGCAKVGMNIAVATPEGYACNAEIVENAKNDAKLTGANITITSDPVEAVSNADVIYTDTWVSMGQEAEKQERIKIFKPYQVNQQLFSKAKQDAIFLHCLPAYRGFEVTEDVIDGPQSAIFDEAENRLHAQKAVMAILMA